MNITSKVVHCKIEASDVYIGRPGSYGNPFKLNNPKDEQERQAVMGQYQVWIKGNPDFKRFVKRNLEHKTLGCWCAPRACHGDVLAKIANDPSQTKEPPIFVFGSNLAGRHGKGAALFAKQYRGAIYGQGKGLMGNNAYGIPTKDHNLRTLPLEAVKQYVKEFLEYAKNNPDKDFDVTAIGCGLAGFKHQEIAPLFAEASDNCRLPGLWNNLKARINHQEETNKVVILGKCQDEQYVEAFERISKIIQPLKNVSIISMADQVGEAYATTMNLSFERIPLELDHYGKDALQVFNQHLVFLGTQVITIGKENNFVLSSLVKLARTTGLATRELHLKTAIHSHKPINNSSLQTKTVTSSLLRPK